MLQGGTIVIYCVTFPQSYASLLCKPLATLCYQCCALSQVQQKLQPFCRGWILQIIKA